MAHEVEKICPWLSSAAEDAVTYCVDGVPSFLNSKKKIVPWLANAECRLWENGDCWNDGDCGLKVARGDRWKEAWEALKVRLKKLEFNDDDRFCVLDDMNKIEREMGKE